MLPTDAYRSRNMSQLKVSQIRQRLLWMFERTSISWISRLQILIERPRC